MNALAWLESREPAPPPQLLRRMLEVLADHQLGADVQPSRAFREAGLHLLRSFQALPVVHRSGALDLLTVDAFITYSCEAACDHSQGVDAECRKTLEELMEMQGDDTSVRGTV